MALQTGTITGVSSTETTITMTFATVPGATGYEVAIRPTSSTIASYGEANGTNSHTFTGLTPGTSYTVNYRGHTADWVYGSYTTGVQISTKESAPEPVPITFDWTWAGLDASGNPVSGVQKAAGLGVYVTAAEWNTLVQLVNQKRGTSIAGVYSGAAISAATVNQVAAALGVGGVAAGQAIAASFFNSLRNAYNNL